MNTVIVGIVCFIGGAIIGAFLNLLIVAASRYDRM